MVYVITRGSYSDYQICAVASTQERAEQLRKMYSNNYEMANIEEYEIDVPSNQYYNKTPILYWKVILKRDGSLIYLETYYDESNQPTKIEEGRWNWRESLIVSYIQADTQEQAIKIAQDKRAQYLAEKFRL